MRALAKKTSSFLSRLTDSYNCVCSKNIKISILNAYMASTEQVSGPGNYWNFQETERESATRILTKSYESTRKHKQTSVKLKLKACDNEGMARARACLDN